MRKRVLYLCGILLLIVSLGLIVVTASKEGRKTTYSGDNGTEEISKNPVEAPAITRDAESRETSFEDFATLPNARDAVIAQAQALTTEKLAPLTAEQERRLQGQLLIPSEPVPADADIPGERVYALATVDGRKIDLRPTQLGTFQRLNCKPNQRVELLVTYPDLKESQEIYLGVPDGGDLEAATETLVTNEKGQVGFAFTTGPDVGSYGVIMTTASNDVKVFDFWAGLPEWEEPVIRALSSN